MSLKILNELALKRLKEKHPNFPEHALPVPKYSDKTANALTKAVIDFLNLSGCQAERISSSGRYIDGKKVVKDTLGRSRTIGSGKYIPTSGTKGTADISATIFGRSVKIEIKKKDKQSEDQKKYQQQVESARGIYWLIHNFEEFHNKYIKINGAT